MVVFFPLCFILCLVMEGVKFVQVNISCSRKVMNGIHLTSFCNIYESFFGYTSLQINTIFTSEITGNFRYMLQYNIDRALGVFKWLCLTFQKLSTASVELSQQRYCFFS